MAKPVESGSSLLVLEKIVSILNAFTLAKPVLTLTEIKEATGLPGSTAQRLVANLAAHAFLDREGNDYRIGRRFTYWAAPAMRGADLVDVAKPVLETLRDRTGETAAIFRHSAGQRVCVALAETRHVLRQFLRIGDVQPLHAGAAGQVILAWRPDLLDAVMSHPLDPLTSQTLTDPAALRDAVVQTRANGYAISVGQRELGLSSIAAPIFNAQADLAGALAVSGPTSRLPQSLCEELVDAVVESAETTTRMLGGRYPTED